MAKWRFVCQMWPEYHFAGIGQFQHGILEVDDDEKAQVILNHFQFGAIFKLMDDEGNIHESAESYLKAQEEIARAAKSAVAQGAAKKQ